MTLMSKSQILYILLFNICGFLNKEYIKYLRNRISMVSLFAVGRIKVWIQIGLDSILDSYVDLGNLNVTES